MASNWFDWESGQIIPEKQDAYQKLLTLFAEVPKAEVLSNELTIDVQ